MDELIARIVERVGVEPDTARNAIGLILGFLHKEGPDEDVAKMMSNLPGAEQAIADADGEGGMLSSMMGGGVMGLGTKLMGMGLGMGEISGISKETIAFAKEKGDPDTVDNVIAAIPGLSQFV